MSGEIGGRCKGFEGKSIVSSWRKLPVWVEGKLPVWVGGNCLFGLEETAF